MVLEVELRLIFEDEVQRVAGDSIDEMNGKANEQIVASRIRMKQFYTNHFASIEY